MEISLNAMKGDSPSPFNYKNSSYFNYPAKHAFSNAVSGFSRIIWRFHRLSINCIKEYFFPLGISCLSVSLSFLPFLCSGTRDGYLCFQTVPLRLAFTAKLTPYVPSENKGVFRCSSEKRFAYLSLYHLSCASQPFLV